MTKFCFGFVLGIIFAFILIFINPVEGAEIKSNVDVDNGDISIQQNCRTSTIGGFTNAELEVRKYGIDLTARGITSGNITHKTGPTGTTNSDLIMNLKGSQNPTNKTRFWEGVGFEGIGGNKQHSIAAFTKGSPKDLTNFHSTTMGLGDPNNFGYEVTIGPMSGDMEAGYDETVNHGKVSDDGTGKPPMLSHDTEESYRIRVEGEKINEFAFGVNSNLNFPARDENFGNMPSLCPWEIK